MALCLLSRNCHGYRSHRLKIIINNVHSFCIGLQEANSATDKEGDTQALSVPFSSLKTKGILQQFPPHVNGSLFVDDFQIPCTNVNMAFIELQLQTTANCPKFVSLKLFEHNGTRTAEDSIPAKKC
ncbi:hypothetical protein CEXT_239831 [Caerostris extrusa]|uniref:Uncharacterized protein n=1 Tax=Caerostris extrusa TaxID=172846 RepID=A0AAV4S780_CAEEX|nr:hypothetical protein CEXT_239831 [Caerostris extrusa]